MVTRDPETRLGLKSALVWNSILFGANALRSFSGYPKWRSTRAKMEISVWAFIVTETDSPTSHTCSNGFPNLKHVRVLVYRCVMLAPHVFKSKTRFSCARKPSPKSNCVDRHSGYPAKLRTRLTRPITSREFETTRRARSDSCVLSRRVQPPLGTGKGTRARVVALHKCATRPATAAIDSAGPDPPTKIAKCDIIPRRAD